MTLKEWFAIQDEYRYKTLRSIKTARNADRQNALDSEKVRPPCPDPDLLPPSKAEMRDFYDLVWLGQERKS